MYCLWCSEPIIQQLTWQNFFFPDIKKLCVYCDSLLEKIDGDRCHKCSRQCEQAICFDCQRWEKEKERDTLVFNYSIFQYNIFMQELIAKWKYRGDVELGNIFRDAVRKGFTPTFAAMKKHAIAVPIPLSKDREKERGFNQAKILADFLPIKSELVLHRMEGEKQSKKSRKERIQSINPFSITKSINKPVILVDDIYTTGTTLRHAGKVLKENGCPEVFGFTLIRG
ncbi:ComF family protein [Virgibacillus sp. M23]|uniref:ComF family protein n=1 Tax=Virgibacillus sp. M23 TaxID=3079030 RepID=UPI002A912BEC|nr:ComF family protein [Virgibacillus sp. M23]MDY7042863.1 ComF family protein [Virgibacillus sp. M23]